MESKKPANIEEYKAGFPDAAQAMIEQIRQAIKKVAPEADEVISYEMPTYKINGNRLVYFAGFKNHIGFYPRVSAIEAFSNELSIYKSAKGSVQFPLNKPMPIDLITRMVEYRLQEELGKK